MNHFGLYTDQIGQNTDHAILPGSIYGRRAFEGYWLSCTARRPTLLVGTDPTREFMKRGQRMGVATPALLKAYTVEKEYRRDRRGPLAVAKTRHRSCRWLPEAF